MNIKFQDYKLIKEEREIALKKDIGRNFTEVKATLNFNKSDNIKARIRLKGDLNQHWRSNVRFSFRVSLKGDNTILGYKSFSLHKPVARAHPYDQTFQSLSRQTGNIAPLHNYLHVYVNGEDWGIMNIEEHMSKELLEKQQFKESLILKFGNEKNWLYSRTNKNKHVQNRISDPNLNIKAYKAKKYFNNLIYRKWFSYIGKMQLKNNNNAILYDIDSFSKAIILSMSWNAIHVLYPSNSKFYFNPYTLKIHSITADQNLFTKLDKPLGIPAIYKKVISTQEYKNNLNENINKVLDKVKNIQIEIDKYQKYFPMDQKIYGDTVINNLAKIQENPMKYLFTPKKRFLFDDAITSNSYDIKSIIKPTKEQASDIPEHIYARHYENGEINIYNLLPDKVKLINIYVNDMKLSNIKPVDIDSFKQLNIYEPYTIKTKLKGLYDQNITVETEYFGYKRKFNLDYTHLVNGLYNPLLDISKIRVNDFLYKADNKTWKFKKGNWIIKKPLVIDGDLIIPDGTILNFNTNGYLIVKGSIRAIGKKYSQIEFNALKDNWKGIYILNANKKSILDYVTINNTMALSDGLLNLTGGVNFYKSDVNISNTKFFNSIAEDSLNIVHSKFILNNVTIDKSISDGFDGDFSTGKISNSNFTNISGDAIDFSGSNILVENSIFKNIYDKAISSGEASNVDINNVFIDNVGVGIASKDGSKTSGNNIKIHNFKMNAAMSYLKKTFYDNPELELKNVMVDDLTNAYSRQNKTYMRINGKEIKAKLIDVKQMYKSGVMKK